MHKPENPKRNPKLSGCMVVRNGVMLGYPFVEAILSLLPACDEFVILECESDDETCFWLNRLKVRYPEKIRVIHAPWPKTSVAGSAIGEAQTQCIRACRGRWIYLLQADEIMPEANIPFLNGLSESHSWLKRVRRNNAVTPVSPSPTPPPLKTIGGHKIDLVAMRGMDVISRYLCRSYHVDFLHVVNNFQQFSFEGYRWAVRLARNSRNLYSDDDGWQMNGICRLPVGTMRLPQPVVHVGYNFPLNAWRKRINHAMLYPDNPIYQEAAADAEKQIHAFEKGLLPRLTDQNTLRLPSIIAPLIGQYEYKVREELFL